MALGPPVLEHHVHARKDGATGSASGVFSRSPDPREDAPPTLACSTASSASPTVQQGALAGMRPRAIGVGPTIARLG
jgi:hypothetical protein